MCRVWRIVALLAAGGCLSGSVQAQSSTYPSPVGAARMPEPIPCGPALSAPPAPQPNLVPGPISTQAAPMGPPDCLSLPYDHSSAFQCENYIDDGGMFVHIGPMALQRNKLGAGDIAVYNAQAQGQPFGPVIPNPFIPPPAGTASALNFNSFTPPLSIGVFGTIGYMWEKQSIEFTNFYIWENDVTTSVQQFGGLDTLFWNPPLTFLGDALWRRTDQVTATFGSSLFSSELNYRRYEVFGGLELLAGIRYVRQNDILGLNMQGTAFVENSLGLQAPGRDMAIYGVLTHNNIVAPQVGAEYNLPVWRWFSLTGMAKGAWGVNFLNTDVSLTRGDGLTAFDTHRSATVFGQIYTLGAFADFNLLEKLHLRLGYTSTWLLGVATANDQVDFNLMGFQARQAFGLAGVSNALSAGDLKQIRSAQQSIPHGRVNNNGSIMYFGPQIELQFFF